MNVLEEHGFKRMPKNEIIEWKEWWVKWHENNSLSEIKIRLDKYNNSIQCDLKQEELYILIEYLGASK